MTVDLNTVPQSTQFGLIQCAGEIRQRGQHDLQALTRNRRGFHEFLQVEQNLGGQLLGIVNEQGDGLIVACSGGHGLQQQPAPPFDSQAQAGDRQFEVRAEVIEDIGKIEVGVDQQDKVDIVGLRHAAAQHQRLADPGFAGEQDEPPPLPDTVQDVGASGVVVGVAKKSFGSFDLKGLLLKPKWAVYIHLSFCHPL
ncbi:MAG: hypothetical protein MZV63_19370 [Marinilabiliales bacterium]|nr:hypothetical protein [Marinilabiliales bacterium]